MYEQSPLDIIFTFISSGTLACLFRNHLTLLPSLGTNIEYFAASLLANLEEENTPCSNHEDRDACQTIAIAVANLSELSVSIFTLNMRDNGNASTIFLEKLDITENKAITAMVTYTANVCYLTFFLLTFSLTLIPTLNLLLLQLKLQYVFITGGVTFIMIN